MLLSRIKIHNTSSGHLSSSKLFNSRWKIFERKFFIDGLK